MPSLFFVVFRFFSLSVFVSLDHRCSSLQDMPICYDTTTITGHRQGQLCSVFPTSTAAVSSVQDLYDFICTGPLIKKLGLTPEMVASTMDQWLECGLHLCRLFGMNKLNLTTAQKARLYRYYIPVYLWCEDQILDHRSKFRDGDEIAPLVVFTLSNSIQFILVLVMISYEPLFIRI